MSSGYSKVISFSVTCGTPAAIELPAPPRGVLERVILTQVGGGAEAATCNIYDRKGACEAATDLNVAHSGVIAAVADASGFASVTTTAAHNLTVGDSVEFKNCSESTYNVLQTVTAVVSDTQFITDVAYVSPESAGALWQTAPFNPTTQPITHLVYTFNKLSGTDYSSFDVQRSYENKDNQSNTMRRRASALWLEVLTVGTAETLNFEIAYTCRADTVV
jgi:hypothetical protein